MFCLLPDKLSGKKSLTTTKSYLSCFFSNILIIANLQVHECPGGLFLKALPCFIWSITLLRKTSDIVLIQLTQIPLHKLSLPKYRPLICVVSEWQDVFRYIISCVEKILISIKFILINFGNAIVHQKLNQSSV